MPPRDKPTATLHDLAELRRAWRARQAEQEREREAARRREAEARRQVDERELFRRAVGPVQPIRAAAALAGADPLARRPRPEPLPVSRQRDEQAVLREALSDEFDVDSLLETDAELAYARDGVSPEVLRKLRRGVWVIHGKGHGSPGRTPVLKSKVRAWLVQKQEVMAFVQARACDGGAGALLVLLDAAPGSGPPERGR